MRIILVGAREQRARWRRELVAAGFEVVEEVSTIAQARASEAVHDAVLLTSEETQAEGAEGPEVDDEAFGLTALTDELTARELEVLDLLARGLTNKAIAAHLSISDQTVKFHVGSILGKLGASNRTDAVRRALRRGLIAV